MSAWRFLKRHPGYREAWRAAGGTARAEGERIPIRRQTETDLAAAGWGLLAWEDPLADDGPASPFWADAPMAEGMQGRSGTPSFASLANSRGAALSGLLLLGDGALILKVERHGAAGQVRIEDGAAFDPNGGLGLDLSGDLAFMTLQLRRAGDLRAVLAGADREGGPSPGPWRASSCSPSTAS